MKKHLTLLAALFIGGIGAHATGCLDAAYAGATRWTRVISRTANDTAATCESSAADGDVCAGHDVMADRNATVGGTLTVTGATTLGALTYTGLVTPSYNVYETFGYGASKGIFIDQNDGTVMDNSATGLIDIIYTGLGNKFAYSLLGGASTAGLVMVATGLDVTGDQADNEGVEIYGAIDGASGKMYTPGVTAAFHFCLTVTLTDVSDTDDLHVSIRSPEVTNAAYANFNTYAGIGIQASAATATIHTQTEDDAGGQTDTALAATWADTATKILCVKVAASRAVTYTVNGSTDANAVAFSFDAGEPLIPSFWWIHAGAADAVPILTNWDWGLD